MQPYLFPYIGYYQLAYASDVFIFYDDVSYIKQSYINRNNILVNGKTLRFTLPVLGASSNVLIESLDFSSSKKILRTIEQAYKNSPYFDEVFPIIEFVFNQENRSITHINSLSIQVVFDYLDIKRKFMIASHIQYDRDKNRADRLIELANIHGCNHYINSPGGKTLYEKDYFKNKGIELSFIDTKIKIYNQISDEFVPYLSMIDILMNCSKKEVVEMLEIYALN